MEQDRDIDSVLMNVQKTSGGIVSAMTFSARISFMVLSFIYRLANKGMVSMGLCDRFKSFMAETNGDFNTYNVPISEESKDKIRKLQELEKEYEMTSSLSPEKVALRREIKSVQDSIPELAQLERLGIKHCVLPKLNGSENTMQVAVAKTSDESFKTWFLNNLNSKMSGGEKTLEELKVFTEGNYTILNFPFERKSDSSEQLEEGIEEMTDELADALTDFDKLQINYAVLPDLKIGDGYTQIAIPNVDREKVSKWVELFNQKNALEGKEERTVTEMDADAYLSSSEITPAEYINGADNEYQAVQAEFEAKSTPIPWTSALATESSPRYVELLKDSRYDMVTINKESLVDNRIISPAVKKLEQEGFFTARIPGTYNDKQQTLVLPKENVIEIDGGRTYAVFLDKTKSYQILTEKGVTLNMDGESLKKKYDDMNERKIKMQSYVNNSPKVTSKVAEHIPTITPFTPK